VNLRNRPVGTDDIPFLVWNRWDTKLPTHLHLTQKLRMSGSIIHTYMCPHKVHKDEFTFSFCGIDDVP